MIRIRGTFRGVLGLALGLAATSVQAQTVPSLPFPGSSVPAGTLGIANAGGLGFAGALSPNAAVFSGTILTGGLTNPGGLSLGSTTGSVGGTGIGAGAGIAGTGLTSDLDTGLTTGSIGGTGAGIGTRSGVLDPNRLTSGIGTGGGGGTPAGAGIGGASGAIDIYGDPFSGRGMR